MAVLPAKASSLEFNGPSATLVDVQRKDIRACVVADHIEIVTRAHEFVGVDAGDKESRFTDERSDKDFSERPDNNAAPPDKRTIVVPTRHIHTQSARRRLNLARADYEAPAFVRNMTH